MGSRGRGRFVRMLWRRRVLGHRWRETLAGASLLFAIVHLSVLIGRVALGLPVPDGPIDQALTGYAIGWAVAALVRWFGMRHGRVGVYHREVAMLRAAEYRNDQRQIRELQGTVSELQAELLRLRGTVLDLTTAVVKVAPLPETPIVLAVMDDDAAPGDDVVADGDARAV